jgi:hypothetical protein
VLTNRQSRLMAYGSEKVNHLARNTEWPYQPALSKL